MDVGFSISESERSQSWWSPALRGFSPLFSSAAPWESLVSNSYDSGLDQHSMSCEFESVKTGRKRYSLKLVIKIVWKR